MLSVGLAALPTAGAAIVGIVTAILPVIAIITALVSAGFALYYA